MQGMNDKLYVSSHLGPGPNGRRASPGQLAFQKFIREQEETVSLLAVVEVLIHPQQYALTRGSLERHSTLAHIRNRIREWAFGFNVVTVVVNREALTHRDKRSGGLEYFDQLVTVGGDSTTVLELPGIGARLQYTSGAIVMFSGNTHLHGVSASQKERVCFASYARPSVQKQQKIPTPRPPTVPSSLHHRYWLGYINEVLAWARRKQ